MEVECGGDGGGNSLERKMFGVLRPCKVMVKAAGISFPAKLFSLLLLFFSLLVMECDKPIQINIPLFQSH
ncbi:hypothetical protein L1987_63747 [Smallanthus sonchifolius]|uniref:Uncharacterized protein n=1 Tax=Smallanthus sonchifolius TaxID=185202 RepID=A0ACB9CE04_9ASTR|nr:hypothetical protein L1987_63747 [Smallanthus sonchifolius]